MSRNGEDFGLKIYFAQIERVPLLKKKDEKKLAKRIEMGNQEARRRFILANLRLVVPIAKRYAKTDHRYSLSELIQYGTYGLIAAVDGFNWRLRFKFSIYAEPSIKRAIMRELARQLPRAIQTNIPIQDDTEIRPEAILEKVSIANIVRSAVENLPEKEKLVITMRYFEEKEIEEIAAKLKLSEVRIRQLRRKALKRLRDHEQVSKLE